MLQAASELLPEVGLRATTADRIAARSGVSKATIYKWWPSKYAVAVDAFLSEMAATAPAPDTVPANELMVDLSCAAALIRPLAVTTELPEI